MNTLSCAGEETLGSFKTSAAAAEGAALQGQGQGQGQGVAQALRASAETESAKEQLNRNWLTRFLVVGDNVPSLSADAFGAVVPNSCQSLIDAMGVASAEVVENAAFHRAHIEEGLAIARTIEELQTPAYNSVDAVIHVGSTVDLASGLEAVISRLLAAESAALGCSGSGSVLQSGSPDTAEEDAGAIFPVGGRPSASALLRSEAEEALRDVYRLHWGSSYMRGLLAKGSHLFVSSSAIDLLKATHTSNLQQLARELSPYCVSHLLHMMEKLNDEYQRSSWSHWEGGAASAPQRSVHYMAGGRVCLFELHPKLVSNQEGVLLESVNREERLISDAQLERLSVCLFGPSTHHATFECTISSLVLISPIPFVLGDLLRREGLGQWPSDGPPLSAGRSMSYTTAEIGNVLDMLTLWLSQDPWAVAADTSTAHSSKREAFIVCGGSRINYSSVIRSEDFDFGGASIRSDDQLCIKQLYCGPFIGVAPGLDESGFGEMGEESMTEGFFTVKTSEGCRRYTITPIRASTAAQAGVVTTAEKTQAMSGLDDDGGVLRAPAGCFHLGLNDLKVDPYAFGHDNLPGDVYAVWNMAQRYSDVACKRAAQSKDITSVDQSDICDVVAAAAIKAFRAIDASGLISECQDMFRKGSFGGIQREDDASTNALTVGSLTDASALRAASQGALLGKILGFLLDRMPVTLKRLFPGAPSGTVLRLVWGKHSDRCSDNKALQKSFHQIGAAVRKDDMLYALLSSDFSEFSGLCRDGLLALSLFPHCSLAIGLNDGW